MHHAGYAEEEAETKEEEPPRIVIKDLEWAMKSYRRTLQKQRDLFPLRLFRSRRASSPAFLLSSL